MSSRCLLSPSERDCSCRSCPSHGKTSPCKDSCMSALQTRWHECKCDLSFFFLQLRWFMRRGKAWQECADHSVPRCLSLRLHWVNNCGEGEKTGRWMNAGMNEWMDEGVNEWDRANVMWLSFSTPSGLFVCGWPIICWNNNRAAHWHFFKISEVVSNKLFFFFFFFRFRGLSPKINAF